MSSDNPDSDGWSVRTPSEAEVELLREREPGGGAGIADSHYAGHLAGLTVYGVVWGGGSPVGEAVLDLSVERHRPELKHVFVYPEYRGKGAGAALISWAEREAVRRGFQEVFLGVEDTNHGARRLYQRLGYQSSGVVETYKYQYQEDDGALIAVEETAEIFSKNLA